MIDISASNAAAYRQPSGLVVTLMQGWAPGWAGHYAERRVAGIVQEGQYGLTEEQAVCVVSNWVAFEAAIGSVRLIAEPGIPG